MPGISYVYVKHDVDSGFVTYNKSHTSKYATASTAELAKTLKEEQLKDVQKVRQGLKLDGSNKILIAISWLHDQEVRKTKLFLEYIVADATFGLNRQTVRPQVHRYITLRYYGQGWECANVCMHACVVLASYFERKISLHELVKGDKEIIIYIWKEDKNILGLFMLR